MRPEDRSAVVGARSMFVGSAALGAREVPDDLLVLLLPCGGSNETRLEVRLALRCATVQRAFYVQKAPPGLPKNV